MPLRALPIGVTTHEYRIQMCNHGGRNQGLYLRQGTAADILKLAITRILAGLPEREWLKPILQIHDELTFIIPEDRLSEAVAFIRACMEEKPFPEFDLPLIAEALLDRTLE